MKKYNDYNLSVMIMNNMEQAEESNGNKKDESAIITRKILDF